MQSRGLFAAIGLGALISLSQFVGCSQQPIQSAEQPAASVDPPPPAGPAPTRVVKPYVPSTANRKTPEPDRLPLLQDGKPVRIVEEQGFKLALDLSPQSVAVSTYKSEVTRSRADEIGHGDTVEVTVGNAALRVGDADVAAVPKGRRLHVDSTSGDWLAAQTVVDGELKAGWISAKQVKLIAAEPRLYAVPAQAHLGKFIPTGILIQKAKQFDDGLYAAVELAAQNGAGQMVGKKRWLQDLLAALADDPPSVAAAVVGGAAQLGNPEVTIPQPLQPLVQAEIEKFQIDPLRSKPLGFYTWSDELAAIFRQDRLLQTELNTIQGGAQILAAMQSEVGCLLAYRNYLALVAKLTNPWEYADLTQVAQQESVVKQFRILPPSRSHEATLVKKLFSDRPIPDGFDLMNELIARVQAGTLDLTPTPDSGWYDYQTYSLEPFARPDKMPEAAKLKWNDEYKKLLLELFKGAIALARETHIKQLEIPPAPASAPGPAPLPRKKIYISLQMSVEPNATHYRRRAEAYRFVHNALRAAFGTDGLAKMHRLTADGPVEMNLEDELQQMTSLFEGAALTAARQLGLPAVGPPLDGATTAEPAAETFLKWAAVARNDVDLEQDARMMVPVFYDLGRKKTKVWAFLGWTTRSVNFAFDRRPQVTVFDAAGKEINLNDPQSPELFWNGVGHTALVPVTAEVYVDRILNREEFRRHCDAYQSRSAILANLP